MKATFSPKNFERIKNIKIYSLDGLGAVSQTVIQVEKPVLF